MTELYTTASDKRDPTLKRINRGCCSPGRNALQSLAEAALLQGQPGYEDVTDEVVEHRGYRAEVAGKCLFATSGICALKAAGLLPEYP